MTSSEFSHHESCPSCGSSDALSRYTDGHGYCFSCTYYEHSADNGDPRDIQKTNKPTPAKGDLKWPLEYRGLTRRKLSEATTKKFLYGVAEYRGDLCQIATYCTPSGERVAQKVRTRDKDFCVLGDLSKAGLYGQHLWSEGGKRLVITEGEIDCLSVSQLQDNKWPVVSVPNGAQGALKAILKQIKWVESFDKVVICFDMDDPGREAAVAVAEALEPGKAYIASLPLKDPNEMLQANRGRELIDALWGAKQHRPDGIISGSELTVDSLMEDKIQGHLLGFPKFDEMTGGVRKGEVTLLTAGTGIGKSTLAREVGWKLVKEYGLKVGNMYLEESYKKTAKGYIAIDHNVPLKSLRKTPEILTASQYEESLGIMRDRMCFLNHFGSLDSNSLINQLKFMAVGLGMDFIILDHVSIVVSGLTSTSREGERKDIDILMTNLRSLVERTGVGVICIAHLKDRDGKHSHEEGGQVSLRDLRGSATLKQIPDTIFALERDQQADDPDVSKVRVLKARETGDTGLADSLRYHKDTGRLLIEESDDCPFEEEKEDY